MKKFLLLSVAFLIALAGIAANSYFTTDQISFAIQQHDFSPYLALTVAAMDTTRARAAYERVQNICGQLIAKFPESAASSFIISQDFILSEQVIDNNKSQYTFDLWNKTLQGQTNPRRPLQKGVVDNDLFLAIGVRLLIDSRVQGQSNVKVQTFPVDAVFAPSGATTDDLWSIYNAQWSLTVDRVVYVSDESTRKMLYVPAFNLSDSTGVTTEPINTLDGGRYHELDPYPIISGRLDNDCVLDIPLYSGWNGEADTAEYSTLENVISLEFTGYTIKNGYRFIQFFNGTKDINDSGSLAAITQNS